jgi:hypothetical protein
VPTVNSRPGTPALSAAARSSTLTFAVPWPAPVNETGRLPARARAPRSGTDASPAAGHATVAGFAGTAVLGPPRDTKSLAGTDFSFCVAGACHGVGLGLASAGSAVSRLPAITAVVTAAIHFFTVLP